tara:strand:- start:18681 stop:19454 length:774 start_codon:yes stop_codon:yes gene_type:complete
MFSKNSISYLTQKQKFHFKNFLNDISLNKYVDIIRSGSIPRPQYGLGMLLASNQACQLNIKKISIIEIGFYDKTSINDLLEYKRIIEKILPIEIYLNYFNIPHKLFNLSNSIKDRKDLFKNLTKNNKVEKFKNIAISNFTDLLKNDFLNKPIGLIIFDTKNYTITNNSFRILGKHHMNFLPKTFLYFDHLFRSSEFEGEYLSIKKFNLRNKKKISDILELPEQLSVSWTKWLFLAKRLKYLINFQHPKFKNNIKQII